MPPACDQVAVAREAAEAREREQGGGSPSLTQLLSLAPETLRAWLRSSLAVRGGAEAEEAAEAEAEAEAAAEAEAEEAEEEERGEEAALQLKPCSAKAATPGSAVRVMT